MPSWDDVLNGALNVGTLGAYGAIKGNIDDTNAKNDTLRQQLQQQAAQAGAFGNQLAGDTGAMTGQLGNQAQYLRDIQSGKVSLSSEQLRQGLMQQLAQQRSFAASASPGNSPMAALNAANAMGRASYGMSGQAAAAGIAERNAATQALSQQLLGQRGQDIGGANQAYGTAVGGYGAALGNPYQNSLQQYAPMIQAGASALGTAASDRRLKKNIKRGDADAAKAIEGLRSYVFEYKNKRFGKGKQVGIMAQDLEKVGLKHAVIDTPAGKLVHGAKLATSNTAMIAELGRRLSKIEGARK